MDIIWLPLSRTNAAEELQQLFEQHDETMYAGADLGDAQEEMEWMVREGWAYLTEVEAQAACEGHQSPQEVDSALMLGYIRRYILG